jgi:hypothetical protein
MAAQITDFRLKKSTADNSVSSLLDISLRPLGIRYWVDVTDQAVFIITKSEAELPKIKSHIEKELQHGLANLGYTVLNAEGMPLANPHDTENLLDAATLTPSEPEDNFKAIKSLFFRLFGKHFLYTDEVRNTATAAVASPFKSVSLEKIFSERNDNKEKSLLDTFTDIKRLILHTDVSKGAFSHKQILFSRVFKGTGIKLLEKYCQSLRVFFADNLDSIVAKWINGDKHQTKHITVKNLNPLDIEDFLHILEYTEYNRKTKETQKTARLCFNAGAAYRLIFPPLVKQVKANSLEINKKHYVAYVQSRLVGKPLLSVYKPSKNSKKLSVKPILFQHTNNPGQEYYSALFSFIMDFNGGMIGMRSHYPELIDNIMQLINQLKPNRGYFVDIVTAEEGYSTYNIFNDHQIRRYMTETETPNSIYSNPSATKLAAEFGFGTSFPINLYDEILQKFQPESETTVTPILFLMTDTRNTDHSDEKIKEIQEVLRIYKAKNLAQPKIFIFNFGEENNDNKARLEPIANLTGIPVIHVKSMEDFKKIYHYLPIIQHGTRNVDLVVTQNGTANRFEVPLFLDGNAHAVNVARPFLEEERLQLEIDGKPSFVAMKTANEVPVASIKDWALALQRKAHQHILATQNTDKMRLAHLQKLQVEVDKALSTPSDLFTQEQTLLQETAELVSEYITDLKTIITTNDSGLRKEQINRAKFALNYTNIQRPIAGNDVDDLDINIEDVLSNLNMNVATADVDAGRLATLNTGFFDIPGAYAAVIEASDATGYVEDVYRMPAAGKADCVMGLPSQSDETITLPSKQPNFTSNLGETLVIGTATIAAGLWLFNRIKEKIVGSDDRSVPKIKTRSDL